MTLIKQLIGVEDFSDVYSKANKKRIEVKEERKRKLAQIVNNFFLFFILNDFIDFYLFFFFTTFKGSY